jgi:hypothetical protein
MENEDNITITVAEYEELIDDALLLVCLRLAGVDNWQGYDYALEMYHERIDKIEKKGT